MENCLICGRVGKKLFTIKGREFLRCSQCDFVWIKNFKEPDYQNYRLDQTYFDFTPIFKNIFRRIYKISQKHFKLKPNKGQVFEIGASVGNLLEIFREHGWEVSGIEPSNKSREVALGKGINLLPGTWEKAKIKPNFYDIILINHTLEHVADPEMVLTKIHKSLKKGGLLVIGVPNFGSMSAKILKQKWMHTNPEEHKWQFSPKSLNLLVQKTGFRPLAHYTSSGIFEFDSPIQELVLSLVTMKKRFFTNLLTIPSAYLMTKLDRGTGLLLIAQK